jgi:hypothetical protein
MDPSTKKDINEYLFYEFGLEGDEDQISDTWPFDLKDVGSVIVGTQESKLFQFSDGQESYFALELPGLNFFPAVGMTAEQIQLQVAGSRWIGQRTPIDLDTVRIGDDSVPSIKERRAAVVELASTMLNTSPTDIRVLEGLYLSSEGTYVALVELTSSNQAYVIGTDLRPFMVGFHEASDWRRLSVGIGEMLSTAELSP